MPILNPVELELMKVAYARDIHNTLLSIRKHNGAATTYNANPLYKTESENAFTEYSGFPCSVYYILSGKVNRLFDERNLQTLKDIGLLDEDIWVVNYIQGFEFVTGVLTDLQRGDQIELNTGDWYYVQMIVEDSEGLQAKAIVTK